MRVGLLCYRGNPYCGGQGGYLYPLARELARQGHEVEVIVGRPYPRPLGRWARVHKVRNLNLWGVYRREWLPRRRALRLLEPWNLFDFAATRLRWFPEPFSFSFRAFSVVAGILRRRRLDILHDVQSLGYGVLAMKALGVPVVTTVHHPLTIDRREALARNRTLEELYHTVAFYPVGMQGRVIRRLDGVITASRAGREAIRRDFRVDAGRIAIVPNGVDLEHFRPGGEEARDPATLLFVGHTDDPRKGAGVLLRALQRLPEPVRLRIVDEGAPRRTLLPREVERLGLGPRVTFTGRLSPAALAAEYRRTTVLVQPSLYEGFGLPAAEAAACGTPVVATRTGAVDEVLAPGAALLVPPGDPEALAGGIAELLDDPARRRAMREAAPGAAAQRYGWPAAAARTAAVYRRVAAGLPPGGAVAEEAAPLAAAAP